MWLWKYASFYLILFFLSDYLLVTTHSLYLQMSVCGKSINRISETGLNVTMSALLRTVVVQVHVPET